MTPRARAKAKAPAALNPGIPLADLADSWEIELRSQAKARNTVRLYTSSVARFIAWHHRASPGPVTLECLGKDTAAAWLADTLAAGAAPASARIYHASLRQFSGWLAEQGETDYDVLLGLRPPKLDAPTVDGITGAELDALLKACRAPAGAARWAVFECLRDEALIRLLADTGMRAGELIALRVEDVDLRRRLVTIRRAKGGKNRFAAFSAKTATAIDKYLRRGRRGHALAGTPALWLGSANRPFQYDGLRKTLGRRARMAGLAGFHAHKLRHTSASLKLRAGISEGEVMSSHGWASRSMLDRYTQDTAMDRAADSMRRYFDQQEGR